MFEDDYLYKATIEHSPIGIGLYAPGGRFLDVNRVLCVLTGHEAQMLCKRDLFDLCHPDHTECMRHGTGSLLTSQRDTLSMETRLIRQDGTAVWVQTDVAVVHDHGNQHLVVQVQDVTVRRLALESLRASERRLVYVPDGAGLGTFDWSTRVRHVSFNRRTVDMLSYEPIDLSNDPNAWFAMVHPQDAASSMRRIYCHMRGDADSFEIEQRMHARHDQWIQAAARGCVTERDARGMATCVGGTLFDVTKRRTALDQAHHLVLHDPLTDLPNVRLLRGCLFVAIQAARRARGQVAAMFTDLDRFKPVNGEYGHAVGNLALRAMAMRLRSRLRAFDTVARLGDDESVAVFMHCATRDDMTQIVERLIEQLQAPFRVEGHVLSLDVSTDMALRPTDEHDAQTFTCNVNVVMYKVKRTGDNGLGFHASPNYKRLIGMRSRDRGLDGEADARQSITAH